MFLLTPRITLLLLLTLAAVIMIGGVRLARREDSVRIDRDREAMRRFSGEVHAELQRLEALYEEHLTRIARDTPLDDSFEIRRSADQIIGIRQFSVLHPSKPGAPSMHVPVTTLPGERMPEPTFKEPRAGVFGVPMLLSEAKILHSGERGWIEEPGKPLMFWLRRSPENAVVLLIDPPAVEDAMTGWLRTWTGPLFGPVSSTGGPDQLRDRKSRVLASVGVTQASNPDLLVPLRSRFGMWDIASWDRRETQVTYATQVLAASGTLAVLVALLAFIISAQQRRAFALAAQRVSFVNRVSHELRTPLTNILLNLDVATDAAEDLGAEPVRRLALVQEEARRLGRLIDNVLTFSRHEQGKLRSDPRACVPASAINAVVEQFAPSFARRALVVQRSGEVNTPCLLDSDALAQIVANLLSNVEKYVPGGTVQIASTLADNELTITITDEGPGIPERDAERIFSPFERLDSRVNEGASGTGLGLAIARDLAASMGGALHLVPSVRGASFQLRVPAPLAEPPKSISIAS